MKQSKGSIAKTGKNNPMFGRTGDKHPMFGRENKWGHQTEEAKEKIRKGNIGKQSGNKHGMWKGDDAGICAMHHWVIQIKGPAKNYKCIDCNKQARDWSNIDHSYKRILEDYLPRCGSCHQLYDIKYNNRNN